jgi:hypothetical protein
MSNGVPVFRSEGVFAIIICLFAGENALQQIFICGYEYYNTSDMINA